MKQSVLFVDDDVSLLTGLKRMLRSNREEWNLTFVEDPIIAVEAMRNTCFDVVVTDMRMPGLDGAQLLNEVRTLCPHSFRIILSGQAELATVLRAVEHAHRYVTKPCDAEFLKDTIREVCKLHEAPYSFEIKQQLSQLKCVAVEISSYEKLVRLLEQDEIPQTEVANLIASDLGMASKIMQLVNSAFFTSTEAPNCTAAVKILGAELIKKLVLEVGIFEPGLNGDARVGLINRFAIQSINNKDINFEELAGFRDFFRFIGFSVLLQLFSAEFEKFSLQLNSSQSIEKVEELEMSYFGITHGQIGSFLLQLWGFSDEVISCVGAYKITATELISMLAILGDTSEANLLNA
jgi:CheY-like chemotaxis protein